MIEGIVDAPGTRTTDYGDRSNTIPRHVNQ
jgi:hypothetical protein